LTNDRSRLKTKMEIEGMHNELNGFTLATEAFF
jgi:hypothetical protein